LNEVVVVVVVVVVVAVVVETVRIIDGVQLVLK
jgi:hypothetical protein